MRRFACCSVSTDCKNSLGCGPELGFFRRYGFEQRHSIGANTEQQRPELVMPGSRAISRRSSSCSDTIRRSRLRLSWLRRLSVRASSLASSELLRISGGPIAGIRCS